MRRPTPTTRRTGRRGRRPSRRPPAPQEWRTSSRGSGTHWWRQGFCCRARAGGFPAPAPPRRSWWERRRAGTRRRARGSSSPSPPPAAELEVERRAGERPRFAEAVDQVPGIRLGNRLGPVGHDGEARRRGADLRGVEQAHRLADRLRRLLALQQRLEHAVDLGRWYPLLPLFGDPEYEIEEIGR